MSLSWNWDKKIGEATLVNSWTDRDGHDVEKEFQLSLYNGNAYLIMLHEFEEDGVEKYELHSFWADETHMKRMLGLAPKQGYAENCHDKPYSRITKFRLSKECRDFAKITAAILKAFDSITIETY